MNKSQLIRSAALGLTLAAFAVPTAGAQQDLRNPDTRDAALAAEARQDKPGLDLRNPDTRDTATSKAPEVTVVEVAKASPASGGLDWGDAGIGAGGLLGLILLGLGGTLAILRRRQNVLSRRQTATSG